VAIHAAFWIASSRSPSNDGYFIIRNGANAMTVNYTRSDP
jgi:hypothetical protein